MRHQMKRRIVLSCVVATAMVALASPADAGLPDSPDGTVSAVIQSLADRHPEILWQALPPGYQQDISDVTHAAAEKMDPELWDAIFRIGTKVSGVLRDKKEFFLNSSMMNAAGEEKVRVEENWDTAVSALDNFFTSEFSNLETFKTMDWERFLSTTGVELMDRIAELDAQKGEEDVEEMIAKLRATTVETVSQEGDKATVRISAPDEDPEEVPLTRVEGRWVPSDMADDWDSNMAEAKENIANLTEEQMAQAKMQAMMVMGMADAAIDQIAATTTQDEFDQALQGLFGPFLGMAGGMQE